MNIHQPDHQPYRHFTQRQRVDMAVQTFRGLVSAITIDGELKAKEVAELLNWIQEYSDLLGRAPFTGLKQKFDEVLMVGMIDDQERQILRSFFEDFIELSFARMVRAEDERVKAGLLKSFTLPGICSRCPEIAFGGRLFAFTATSTNATRRQIVGQITRQGAGFSLNLISQTHYLVVGAGGNRCWDFSDYGHKVDKAVGSRKSGNPILIVHESDFWDAVAGNK